MFLPAGAVPFALELVEVGVVEVLDFETLGQVVVPIVGNLVYLSQQLLVVKVQVPVLVQVVHALIELRHLQLLLRLRLLTVRKGFRTRNQQWGNWQRL